MYRIKARLVAVSVATPRFTETHCSSQKPAAPLCLYMNPEPTPVPLDQSQAYDYKRGHSSIHSTSLYFSVITSTSVLLMKQKRTRKNPDRNTSNVNIDPENILS